jgi:hypothetical protein
MTAVVLVCCVSLFAQSKGLPALVGKKVVLEGTAANAKMGALLLTREDQVWIDGLGFWSGEVNGKRIRVEGTIIKRDDMPVFVYRPGELISQGCPVRTEAERERLKRRYLVKGARWAVLGK